MVKKFVLDIQPEPSVYHLLGISCHLPDYRISHLFNQQLGLCLQKKEDLVTRSYRVNTDHLFSFYHFDDEDNYCEFMLLANRTEEALLVSEMKQIDYFLIIDGELKRSIIESLIKNIRSIPSVLTSFEIKPISIKNASMLFSDIEMHLTYLKRAERLVAGYLGARKSVGQPVVGSRS